MEHKLSDADSGVGLVHQYTPSPPRNPMPFYRGATCMPQLEDDKKGEGKNLWQANSYVHIATYSLNHHCIPNHSRDPTSFYRGPQA